MIHIRHFHNLRQLSTGILNETQQYNLYNKEIKSILSYQNKSDFNRLYLVLSLGVWLCHNNEQ